ncbi:hypothetical protein M2T82_10630 [Elizabethkingia ursingii]|uniref:hypothetical protein n=1 Tax=Elizabethkingia ursingii TaxID=1756150 RepID=UPI0020110747|nr:hypothetical protein [Elizabethkingia ursingii]MCL1668516.1 hypothetical protein [Elizabethkingia ursingii]
MKNRIILSICLSFIYNIKAQSKIDQAIQILDQKYAQEKVYLLFDKEKYISGENMWFKAFVFDGYNRSTISSSLFVELYDSNKSIIAKKVFPINNGEGNGSINLSEKLKEDVYFVRAYTTWMANFGEEFQLVQPIPVYNPASPQRLVINNDSKWTAKAYPEGGTFIENLPTKFAVRLQTEGTPPSEWHGYVTDKDNPSEKITSFKGLDQNIGVFSITPKKGKTYQVVVEDNNGVKQNIDLPVAKDTGVHIQIANTAKGIQYTLKSNNLPGLKDYKVIGTVSNLLAYKANISINNKEASSTIPSSISNKMNGILQLAVFDEKENLVAQRLCFIDPSQLHVTQPTVSYSQADKTARAYNTIEIPPQENYSNYTVVVRDDAKNTEKNNVLSALWLTGDFSSKITAPAQYFAKNANTEALDGLLISEKWNRFDWNAVMAGKTPDIKYNPEPYFSYRGKLTVNSRPLPNTSANLIFKTLDNTVINEVQTDDGGYFMLHNINTDEPIKVTYFLNTLNKAASNPPNLRIAFEPTVDFVTYRSSLPATQYHLEDRQATNDTPAPEIARAIANKKNQKLIHDNEILIKEVQLKAKKRDEKRILNDKLSSGIFRSMNEQVFDLVNENQDAQSSQNILQWLQGRVAGLTFQMDTGGNYVPYMRGGQAKLYMDEVPMDASMINSTPVSNIAMVKVIKGSGLIGNAVAIYTRRGDTQPATPAVKDPFMDNTATILGYDKVAEFYNPDYSKEAYKTIPSDTRDVLYWNPDLKAQDKAPSAIQFYNNDTPTNYQVIIIGFDKDDKPLYYNGKMQ